jgi:hypothetical protein
MRWMNKAGTKISMQMSQCHREIWKFAVALTLLLAAASIYSRATTIERMSLAQMTRAAQLIVRGHCVENSVGWDEGEIWTFTSFDVDEVWSGTAPARITVRLLGGRTGNITSSVSGIPRFMPGEDVVLFLETTARGDYSVVSWQQGTFRVRHSLSGADARVTQDTATFATFDPAARKFAAGGIRDVALDTFRARVEAAVREAGRKP